MSIISHLIHRRKPYPLGLIVEGAASLQCCCPVCNDYYDPKAWKESFLDNALSPTEVVKCERCGTEFLGRSMGGKGRLATDAEIAAACAAAKKP